MDGLIRIVAGYHSSQASLHALAVAKSVGTPMSAEIHVVHGIELLDYPLDPEAPDWEKQGEAFVEGERETVETVMADYVGPWHYHQVRGSAYRAICQLAETCEPMMVIVGRRHVNRVAERLGSHSLMERLFDGCSCPVLVVTTRGTPS